jgi:transcription elongation factor GreA
MLEAVRQKLLDEVEALNHELHVVLPEVLKRAREHGDLRENGDYQAAVERQQFIQVRLGHLSQRLSRLSNINPNEIPRDRIGLGSRVTVRDLETEETEVWELVIPDAMDVLDAGHISVSSPLGRALLNRVASEEVIVDLPRATRRLRIESVLTFHDLIDE